MLKLGQLQISHLRAASEPASDAALTVYARRRFGHHLRTTDEATLLCAVQHARRVAASFGISADHDVAMVLDLTIMYGPEFAQADWAADVLSDPRRDGNDRARKLRARVRRTVADF